MSRNIIIYGFALAVLLILMKWLEWRFIIFDHAIEVYSGALALVFTGLGIWLAVKLARPKVQTVVIVQPAPEAPQQEIDEKEMARLGLSGREQEVLQLMAEGLSNQEIADRLFVSLNTVKTHCSRIFEKLDVRRRTQAIEKSKRLRLIR
ncbi:response regulator transcription factor [Flavitalea sp. BT771]|uniref:helix-turn-helix transcriptional regulator n=1 Tax=Flavitalea sp. BT771 TaxID=3063329 RepID=UPI0026E45A73|nr:response regulator transcription factor [Flavitalea sp. BT771]MDO6429609.1 response regulator transcription factor [Flavitalea sp. BT771]MDV6218263.1 response regulator transcription factor [Flavitalea sp. BT771]